MRTNKQTNKHKVIAVVKRACADQFMSLLIFFNALETPEASLQGESEEVDIHTAW